MTNLIFPVKILAINNLLYILLYGREKVKIKKIERGTKKP